MGQKRKIRFGIVLPWPGIKNAETEVISRLKVAADEVGMECIAIDNFGFILDNEYNATTEKINDVDFVITTHFETPKVLDTFYYHTLWNPPEFPLDRVDYNLLINNYIMNDDFLVYDHGSMSSHLKSILRDSPRDLNNASSLMSTFPASAVLETNLDNPKLFYCGMNWDILVDKHGRNESVMKLLDNSEIIKIFGPNSKTNKAWGGVHPWGGYKCYQYPIPFDGFTLLKELNDCGVCLVLSSNVHRRAGAVTNRAFEACAAGAVIISDNNPTMKEMFGDTVLYVNYNKNNPKETYEEIVEKYNWIKNNLEEAKILAKKSQKVFLEKYTLNKYLIDIKENHKNRIEAVKRALFASNEKGVVLVTYLCNSLDENKIIKNISKVIENLKNQTYKNLLFVPIVDTSITSLISDYLEDKNINIQIETLSMFDNAKTRILTDGQLLNLVRHKYQHDYFLNTNSDEVWFKDHISTLVRAIENKDALIAVSGQSYEDEKGYRRVHFFDNVHYKDVTLFCVKGSLPIHMTFPYPGAVLIKNDAHEYLDDELFACIDGNEHMAYLHEIYTKDAKKIAFSKRMTFVFPIKFDDKRNSLITKIEEARFISGLSKFEFFIDNNNSVDKRAVAEMMLSLPIKPLLKLRIINALRRFTKGEGLISNKLNEQYGKILVKYYNNQGL